MTVRAQLQQGMTASSHNGTITAGNDAQNKILKYSDTECKKNIVSLVRYVTTTFKLVEQEHLFYVQTYILYRFTKLSVMEIIFT